MDRLGNLEAFVAAADLHSFTQAAKRLRLSPSALGRRIAALEADVGVTLFHRNTRTVRLTDEGHLFYRRSRGALVELQEAHAELGSLRARPSGRLRVEAPTILGRYLVVPALPRFVARHPGVHVELSLRDTASDQVAEGIDVALRIGPLRDSGLVAKRLGRTRMCICAAPSYLARKGTPRTVEELGRHERLAFAPHGRALPWRLRDGTSVRDVEPGARITVDDAQALIDLAVGGAGLAWVCDFMLAQGRAAGRLVEVLDQTACLEQPVHALSLPTRNVAPKVRAFAAFAAKELDRSDARRREPR